MRTHQIMRGDTLSALAKRYGTTVQALARANGIKNPDLIYAGRSLKISGGRAGQADRAAGGGRPAPAPRSGPRPAPAPGGGPRASATRPRDSFEPSGADYRPRKGDLTQAELTRIMPGLSASKAQQYLPHLNKAMQEAGIVGKQRQAAFLAQLGHESGGLRYMEEIASGAAYEGRRDLGNTRPGDGTRYKGRGPIQLTGRANYRSAGRALGLNLEANPEQAARPSVGFRIAAWFWNSRGLNKLADSGAFREITRRINGGFNGLMDRLRYWARAKAAL